MQLTKVSPELTEKLSLILKSLLFINSFKIIRGIKNEPNVNVLQFEKVKCIVWNINYKQLLTALMPDNCCDSCMTTLIINGALRVGEQINSDIETVLSLCWARCSARISSISSSTWFEARSRRNAVKHEKIIIIFIGRFNWDSFF